MADERTWVTPEAHSRLSDELVRLEARGADADADERARLVELRTLLSHVEIGTRPDDGLVESGMRVVIRGVEDGVETVFVLGDRMLLADDLGDGVTILSIQSPLGGAVDGRRVGEEVTFVTPRGDRTILIVSATPVS